MRGGAAARSPDRASWAVTARGRITKNIIQRTDPANLRTRRCDLGVCLANGCPMASAIVLVVGAKGRRSVLIGSLPCRTGLASCQRELTLPLASFHSAGFRNGVRPRNKEAARVDTMALRALAIVLIANSHLENFYPVRQLAADGLLGNSLFMLSGLGITLSPRTGDGRFLDWYGRRLSRSYPALWLTVLIGIFLIQAAWRSWTPLDFLSNLVWPTPYGFLGRIRAVLSGVLSAEGQSKREYQCGYARSDCDIRGRCGDSLRFARPELDLLFQMMLFGGLLARGVKEMGGTGAGSCRF